MPDNLTVTIGADSTKLRADLALAQSSLRQFGRELKTAADAARESGETTQLQAAAQRYQAVETRVRSLGQEIKAATAAHAAASPVVAALGQRFGELGTRVREVGTAFGETVDRVFPHFREIATLSLAAASAAFVKLTTDAAKSTIALEDSAAAIGITADKLLAIQFAGARAGVGAEAVSKSLERIARLAGAARLEMDKMQGQLGGSTVLAGSASGVGQFGDGVEVARGNLNGLTKEARAAADAMASFGGDMNHAVGIVRGGVKPVLDTSDAFKTLGIDLRRFPDTASGMNALMEEVATRIDRMADSSRKAHIASQLLGRDWAEQLPLLVNFRENVRTAQETIERYSLTVEESEKKQAQAYSAALYTLTSVFDRIKTITGNILGTALVPLFTGLTEALGENQAAIRAWAQTAANNLTPVMRDIGLLFRQGFGAKFETQTITQAVQIFKTLGETVNIVTAAVKGLVSILDYVAVVFNRIFGTQFTGSGLLVAAILLRITGVFRLILASANLVGAIFTRLPALVGAFAGAAGWRALLAMIGPGGWVLLGLTAIAAAWDRLHGKASAAADATKDAAEKTKEAVAVLRGADEAAKAEAARTSTRAEATARRATGEPGPGARVVTIGSAAGGAIEHPGTGPGGYETDAEYFRRTGFHYGARGAEPTTLPVPAQPRAIPLGGFDPTRTPAMPTTAAIGTLDAKADNVAITAAHVEVTSTIGGAAETGGIVQPQRPAQAPDTHAAQLDQFSTEVDKTITTTEHEFDLLRQAGIAFGNWYSGLIDQINAAHNSLMSVLASTAAAAVKAAQAVSSPGADAPTDQHFASGGFVRGPGTGTSDSVLARLSAGEFVLNAASVRALGVGLLHSLNSFADGGLVGAPPIALAAGGLVTAGATSGRPVHLHLGSQSYALQGSESVVDALVSHAYSQNMRSAGVKPSWFAGRTGQ